MKKLLFLVLTTLLFSASSVLAKPFFLNGRMEFAPELEGGCWYLLDDTGDKYQLLLSDEQREKVYIQGRVVKLKVEEANNVGSICMIGQMVRVLEVISIQGYPNDLPYAEVKLSGTVGKTKGGCWYLKTGDKKYQLDPKKLPAKFKKKGKKMTGMFRVDTGVWRTQCKLDGYAVYVGAAANSGIIEKRPADPR